VFIGHFAVAFASKRAAPRTSLGLLVAAVSLLDLLWPILVLAGFETVRIDPGNTVVTPLDFVSYPYSHSLVFVSLWAVVFAGAYFSKTRYWRGAAVIAVGVVSHWVLDVVSHRPDMPLFPGSEKIGLGLWNSLAATVLVEGTAFVLGVWLYARCTRARDAVGRWAWWALVGFLLLTYAGNLAGPPPPSSNAVAALALAAWLFPLWAWWIDWHRVAQG
jgi:hypothetical protein